MATTAEQVRALTRLTTGELSDGEIDALLAANGDVPKLAAADALEGFASTLTSVTSDDISIDDSKRAAILMQRATRLREQALAEADDDGFSFDVVPSGTCRPELTERPCW